MRNIEMCIIDYYNVNKLDILSSCDICHIMYIVTIRKCHYSQFVTVA